ncbi:MAG: gliding motility protein GldM [Paludibacter sp.]
MSGAKNCPETPRQKMIGMMYLVLTAMLALNVSANILDGFSLVDSSLHTSIKSTESRNKELYAEFSDASEKNPEKVKEWLDKAISVKKQSDDLFNYIEGFKKTLVKMVDTDNANDSAYVKQMEGKDNLDKGAEYALANGNGDILEKKIETYRDYLVKLSANNPNKQKTYNSIFSTSMVKAKNHDPIPWKESVFEGMPVAAIITVLTKYQSDIRSSETEIVQYLKSQTDAMDFRVNKITALVVPNSNYVLRGSKYSARIVLSAVDSTKSPEYYIGGSLVSGGRYERICSTVGLSKYEGFIKLVGNDGAIFKYPFKSEYMVEPPSATISNIDMNVVYRGINNNFEVSVPGQPAENISLTVSGGTAVKTSGGKYIIRANQDGSINIAVFAKIDGKLQQMGGGPFRVKDLPDPKAWLEYSDAGGVRRTIGSKTTKSILKSNSLSLIAGYGPSELIKANFRITEFTISRNGGNFVRVAGTQFNDQQIKVIEGLESRDQITIENIKAVGPDNKSRELPPLIFRI